MSFLDIDVILGEDERLPCKFTTDCAHLGFLDPLGTNNDNILPKGFRTELPIWSVCSLKIQYI